MTKPAATDWYAEQELAALLDGLTAELLATPDYDIATWLRDAGELPEITARPMRRLVSAADAQCVVPQVPSAVVGGVPVAILRNQ
jgi:hypothetical protein